MSTFVKPTPAAAVTLARSAQVNNLADATETAFDLLPHENDLKAAANYAVSTGSGNAYLVTLPYAPGSYSDGLSLLMKANHANTGAATVNVNAMGVKSLRRNNGDELVANDLLANKIVNFRYNTTSGYFEMLSQLPQIAVEASDSAAAAAISEGNASTSEGNASGSASAAALSASAASTSEINAADDAIATAADRVQTGLDRDATAADVITTNADAVSTNADAVDTAADVVSTNADVITTNADVLLTAQDVIDANAAKDDAETAAANLPNATTAGAERFLRTNAAGDAWEYRTAANQRTALGLGTAATQDVGVAAGNVLQADQTEASTATEDTVALGIATLKHLLTGTTTITAFSGTAGVTYHCRAEGIFTLTHGTDLIITQGGANITTVAGDTFDVQMITGTACRIINYVWAAGVGDVPITAEFSILTTDVVTRNAAGDITQITYDSGNKQVLTYTGEDLTKVEYYDTDGTTLLATLTLSYTSGEWTGSTWT